MYVAHVANRYLLKRLPDSGSRHHPDCRSYEPPAELSGRGEVAGSAILEDPASGLTTLRLDFSLTRSAGRHEPPAATEPADVARTDGARLTLRGLLHFLWEEAELNRWSPAMAGKRSWAVARARLLTAAQHKVTRQAALTEFLFIPETFSVERKGEIEARRRHQLAGLAQAVHGPRPRMLIVAEVKQVEAARYGSKIVFKHLPELPILVAATLHRQLRQRFESALTLWEADATTHLILVGLFGIDGAGYAGLDEAALMATNTHWIPIEHRWELELIGALTHAERRFTKTLRYNLGADRPLASVVLTDTAPGPTALYVTSASASPDLEEQMGRLIDTSALQAWRWRTSEEAMPALPMGVGAAPASSSSVSTPKAPLSHA